MMTTMASTVKMMVVISDEGDGDGNNSVWFMHLGFTAAMLVLLVFIAGAHSS